MCHAGRKRGSLSRSRSWGPTRYRTLLPHGVMLIIIFVDSSPRGGAGSRPLPQGHPGLRPLLEDLPGSVRHLSPTPRVPSLCPVRNRRFSPLRGATGGPPSLPRYTFLRLAGADCTGFLPNLARRGPRGKSRNPGLKSYQGVPIPVTSLVECSVEIGNSRLSGFYFTPHESQPSLLILQGPLHSVDLLEKEEQMSALKTA